MTKDPNEFHDPRERERLFDEIARLKTEVNDLREELDRLRNSKWFRIRQSLLPTGSTVQRLYLGLRRGTGLKELRTGQVDYAQWSAEVDSISDDDRAQIRSGIAAMSEQPKFSVLMPVYNTPEGVLREAVQSVIAQLYPHWELCIVDDASTAPHVRPVLESFAAQEPRVRVQFRSENGHISVATNDALEMATAPWVGFFDHDDVLREHALYVFAKAIEDNSDVAFLYSDEDKIDENGAPFHHHFKPDWDPYLEECQNYTCHFSVYRTDLSRRIGGLRPGFEGAQDWDFALRYTEQIEASQVVHIPHALYRWRAIEGSTARSDGSKSYVGEAQVKTVSEALERRHELGEVSRIDEWAIIQIRRSLVSEPKVSVMIPTRNRCDLLSKCVSSLRSVTSYDNYEILVIDNGSSEEASARYLQGLRQEPNIRVLTHDGPFNFSRLNNLAAKEASGEVLALLNNDIEIVDPRWMLQMTAYAVRPDVGAVGTRLLYPNGRVQHGGVVIGYQGAAGHAHVLKAEGYAGRAVVDQTMSAVTAACMLVRRELYERIGGLDEGFAVSFNDIDFCLKLRQLGLRNIYAGSVSCIHHESLSRGSEQSPENIARFHEETKRFQTRWRDWLANDPAYNPNLSLEEQTFTPAAVPRSPLPWRR